MTADFRQVVESFYALSAERAKELEGDQLTTEVVYVGYTDALLAMDSAGLPHLLAPVHGKVVKDRRSAAVWITERTLDVEGEETTYADLGCRAPDLVRVFDRLVTEILEISAKTGERLDLVQSRVLAEWRHFLSAARARLSDEIATGLFGELSVLCSLAEEEPHLALDAWIGPTGAVRDFSHGTRAIEVKTRFSGASERVRISSLAQLDCRGLESLLLAVVDIEENVLGQSLGQMVDHAVELGVPRLPLMDLLLGVGYVPGMAEDDERLMRVTRLRTWQVGESFPALTEGNVTQEALRAVFSATYTLDLSRLDEPAVDDWSGLTHGMGWGV